jgi:hypothetical protein
MALNPSGAISLAGPTAGQSIAVELGVSATATISLNDTNVRTLAGVASGVIVMPTDFWGKSSVSIIPVQKGIIAFGITGSLVYSNVTNLISNTGVVASNTTAPVAATGTRSSASYGTDKGIFAFGNRASPTPVTNVTNLLSNTGVVASDVASPTTARAQGSGAVYGGDKAIFNFGSRGPSVPAAVRNITASNLVSNTGVMASDTPTVAVANTDSAAAAYGGGSAIFAFGFYPAAPTVRGNLVSNTGVFEATFTTSLPPRSAGGMTTYGGDKAIYAFGSAPPVSVSNVTNLISNTGVIASNTPGAGTARQTVVAGTRYGGDKGLFYGGVTAFTPAVVRTNAANIVSNTGVVASDSPAVGTARNNASGIGYSAT